MPKTIFAIGAHYDDCPFGIPGILLKAVRQHHRVVVLNLIGDYANWPPVKGREKQLITPDTYVDVSDEWPVAADWLGRLMAFVKNAPFDPTKDSAMETKTALARYRGLACGAKYAEALRSVKPRAVELF